MNIKFWYDSQEISPTTYNIFRTNSSYPLNFLLNSLYSFFDHLYFLLFLYFFFFYYFLFIHLFIRSFVRSFIFFFSSLFFLLLYPLFSLLFFLTNRVYTLKQNHRIKIYNATILYPLSSLTHNTTRVRRNSLTLVRIFCFFIQASSDYRWRTCTYIHT